MNLTIDDDSFILPEVDPGLFPLRMSGKKHVPPLQLLGTSPISNSNNPTDVHLCPGDAFGHLNGTYATINGCRLTISQRKSNLVNGRRLSDVIEGLLESCAKTCFSEILVFGPSKKFLKNFDQQMEKFIILFYCGQ